ncbi:integrase [Vibrio mediterranei]|uniref:phage integrase n=1 Tax=Vibrio mediterranei TaxID=689 RepID=UPI000D17E942|nr:tyrosine-type recombinase/integrase [Vibrio mediterranei]PTC02600.1 integrase [Vibrio mediterranei]
MTIKKDGDKWLVDVRPAGRAGKRFRKKFDKKAEALAYEKHILATANEKAWLGTPKDKRHLSELIAIWWIKAGQFKRTAKAYHSNVRNICTELGDPTVDKINAKLITDWQLMRASEMGQKPSTIRRSTNCLSNVFTELIATGDYIQENPLKGIKRPVEKRPEMTYLTMAQIEILRDAVQDDEEILNAVDICLSTGCRWREMITLKAANLSPYRIRFTETKTDKARTVPISQELYERIYPQNGSNNVFSYDWQQKLRRRIKKLGFELPRGQKVHILRHTFASHFIMNGGNILTLQKILGHSDIQQTMEYAHLAPDFLQDAVKLNPLSVSTKCPQS